MLLTALALGRKGGFYFPDNVAFPAAMAVGTLCTTRCRFPAVLRGVLLAVGLFGGWWLLAGALWGDLGQAANLAGSAVAFGSTAVLAFDAARQSARVHGALVTIGALFTAVSLLGYVTRATDLAVKGPGGHWRLLSPISYQNVAAAVFVTVTVLAMTLESEPERGRRVVVAAALTGLAATLSRGGLLTAGVAAVLVGRRVLSRFGWSISMGALGGAICVATVDRDGIQWLLGAALVIVVAAGALRPALSRRTRAGLVAGLILFGAVATAIVAPSLQERVSRSSLGFRWDAWGGAIDQVREHPIRGAGPEKPVGMDHGATARFAHSEPLQVAAGAGLIGLGLLGMLVAAVVRVPTGRHPGLSAALVALFAIGFLDFAWHSPAVAMLAGWCLGLDIRAPGVEDSCPT